MCSSPLLGKNKINRTSLEAFRYRPKARMANHDLRPVPLLRIPVSEKKSIAIGNPYVWGIGVKRHKPSHIDMVAGHEGDEPISQRLIPTL